MSKDYGEIPLGPQADRHHPGPIKGPTLDLQRTWNEGEHVISVVGRLTGRSVPVRHSFGRGIPSDSALLKDNSEDSED